MMSPLSRFMRAATAVLNVQDAKRVAPSPDRPAIFVRTNWLYAEVDEAIETVKRMTAQSKHARLNLDVAKARELNKQIQRSARQIAEMTVWIEDQFQKECGNGN